MFITKMILTNTFMFEIFKVIFVYIKLNAFLLKYFSIKNIHTNNCWFVHTNVCMTYKLHIKIKTNVFNVH